MSLSKVDHPLTAAVLLLLTQTTTDEFEVSIFLTELSTRHSLLTKQKIFKNEGGRLKSNSGKMTGTSEVPIEVQDDTTVPVMVREESDEQEGGLILKDIPAVEDVAESEQDRESRRKRRRRSSEDLFVSDSPGEGDFQSQQTPSKRNKRDGEHDTITGETGNVEEDKKKMGLSTAYDGFSIYGRILCLVVKRRGTVKGKQRAGAGQAKMEDWIASTQVDQSYED